MQILARTKSSVLVVKALPEAIRIILRIRILAEGYSKFF